MSAAPGTARPAEGTAFLGRALLAVGVVFLPLGIQRQVVAAGEGGDWSSAVYVFPFDLALGVCALLGARELPRLVRARAVPRWLAAFAVLVTATGLAALANPDVRALALLARLAGAGLLAVYVSSVRLDTAAAVVVLVTAGVQAAVAVAQVVHGGPVGLDVLGEYDLPLDDLSSTIAARGTWFHTYALAAFALLFAGAGGAIASRLHPSARNRLLPLVGLAAAPLALTYSRTGALGLAFVVAALAGARPRLPGTRLVAAILAAGFLVPALAWRDGWVSRVEATTGAVAGRQANAVTSNRLHRIRLALDLTRRHPLTGVGPGQYVAEMTRQLDLPADEDIGPVHSVPFLALAESGLVAGLAAASFVVLLGVRAWRGGAGATAVYLAFVPFVLLDHTPYTTGQGLAMTGLWAGAVEALSRPPGAPASGP